LVQIRHSTDAWGQFNDALRGSVSSANWQTWLSRLDHEEEGDTLVLIAPTDFHLQWIRDKHQSAIGAAVLSAYGPETEVAYRVDDTLVDHPTLPVATPLDPPPVPMDEPVAAPSLVSRYRFGSFVVGSSNRFAYAAAMAVAEQPGTNYNPLFIYGSAGLGKTHLLNAVGHHAVEMYPEVSVRYVTSENFLNDFIDCIRRKRVDDFKQRYRSVDVLLLDDVQFFEGKEQILEEFFHTFNNLYESGKQMVISSDRHPRNLMSLEDRLRSRFEWGLLTDIQPPDVETRLAILRRNAELSPRAVPIDVLEFIATLVSDNIRELEGALTRVSAFAALTDGQINLPMAQSVLQDLLPGHEAKSLTAPDIMRATASAFGFSVEEVSGKSRRQPLVLCRQVAMYLCRDLTDLSLPKIGEQFGGRDHTTVMHSVQKIKKLLQTDRQVFDQVNGLSQQLRGPASR
jgi:chromosomal replication initiator protein